MHFEQIAPGLTRWTAPHPDWNGAPDWPEEVGCVVYEGHNSFVLVDPLVPDGEDEDFWRKLDRRAEGCGFPVSVLLTAPWHSRSAAAVAERYETVVWVHEAGRMRLDFPARSDALPAGVEAFEPRGVTEGEVAFLIPEHGALVVAEFLMGVDGGLRVCPSPALENRAAFDESLHRLLELPIERVLVSHGEPVLGDGRRRIAEALSS